PCHSRAALRLETRRWVDAHLETGPSCRADASRFRAVSTGLVALREHEPEPPAFILDAIAERVRPERQRRFLPVPPVIPAELVRLAQDNREALASAAGVALAAGVAY